MIRSAEERSYKILVLIARLLLGLVFVVFGLNGFLHLIPMGPPPAGLAAQFAAALAGSHLVPVFALQVVGGLLLLLGRFVPLTLVLLAPVIVNIVLFHALMAPQGLPLALVVTLLGLVAAWGVRSVFLPILSPALTEKNQGV